MPKKQTLVSLPRDSELVMLISLSSTLFTSCFLHRVYEWATFFEAKSINLILLDELECINYGVFKELSENQARLRAQGRACEIARMIDSILENCNKSRPTSDSKAPVVQRQFESEFTSTSCMRNQLISWNNRFLKSYKMDHEFQTDVNDQVLHNLQRRRATYGDRFFSEHVSELAKYILGELAFMVMYGMLYPSAIEIYPGPNMFVKERLLSNHYAYHGLQPVRFFDEYIDIAFLTV